MKKIYTLILLLMIVLGNISYSGTWQDSVSKRARERGISYAEAVIDELKHKLGSENVKIVVKTH